MQNWMVVFPAAGHIQLNENKGENVPQLGITEVVLVHYNIVDNDYQNDSNVLYTIAPKNLLVQCYMFHQKT